MIEIVIDGISKGIEIDSISVDDQTEYIMKYVKKAMKMLNSEDVTADDVEWLHKFRLDNTEKYAKLTKEQIGRMKGDEFKKLWKEIEKKLNPFTEDEMTKNL